MVQKMELQQRQKAVLGVLALIHLVLLIGCIVAVVMEFSYLNTVLEVFKTLTSDGEDIYSPLMITSVIIPGFVVVSLTLFAILPFTFFPLVIIGVSVLESVGFAVSFVRILIRLVDEKYKQSLDGWDTMQRAMPSLKPPKWYEATVKMVVMLKVDAGLTAFAIVVTIITIVFMVVIIMKRRSGGGSMSTMSSGTS